MDVRFSKLNFLALRDQQARGELGSELAILMSSRLRSASTFRREVRGCIEELRALGHDLWSFDESDEFQTWGPNYEALPRPGIVVTFSAPDVVAVEWSP